MKWAFHTGNPLPLAEGGDPESLRTALMTFVSIHEIGHNLGVTTHDDSTSCADQGRVMLQNPANATSSFFSSCSRSQIAPFVSSVKQNVPGCFLEVLCGDGTGDGVVTVADALRALRIAVGQENYNPFVDVQAPFGFLHVTASDALQVLRRAVGRFTPSRCGEEF